ncbi:Amino acid/amide ABC transporter substrate-binding protein, HAAT family [Frankia canadensis]|uniref:Amino acid/amide ABC transporter substrate-binding protein, HAAT family n=1 Tax=Frankia canadensis TaxID=1836972 RepID=A0A2I2KR92_9ACTN|nr:branched-chain amino acid ABC transporter substrate-binding protein [Frankia canadensis]SNQ48187.1 Amino acid/amide ABC transporter substrate-binding protein, HAAT family [Frankia canadensis]SOU55477.1 Amino acid/amide ABC transporter substrate-binding protein, HAAT family [Frankia canadensis]
MGVPGRRFGVWGIAGVLVATAIAGCGGKAGDDGRKEFAIGFQGPLSGDDQQLGINAYDGLLTAVDLANRRATLPFRLRIIASDDQGQPAQGPAAAQKLIDNPSVIGVVGPVFSGATRTSEPLYSRAGLLSVSPSATSPTLTDQGFTTFYRLMAPDTVQGAAAAEYLAKALHADRVYSLDDRSEYGTGLSGALEGALDDHGVTVIHDDLSPARDYTAQAAKIIAAHPDALYYSGYYSELAPLARALRSKGYTGRIVSGDGANDDQLIRQAGIGNAEGILLTCACRDAGSDPAATGFAAEYRSVNSGIRPGTYSAEAYDAANAIIDVLRRLGTGATRRAVAAGFGSVDLPGVTKRIRFRRGGDVDSTAVYLYEVRGGHRVLRGPIDALVRP